MNQATLARRLGMTQQAVSRWERGLDKPDIAWWPRIAHELGVSPHDMAAVLWGEWNRDDAGELVSIEDLAALITLRARELRDGAAASDGASVDEGA